MNKNAEQVLALLLKIRRSILTERETLTDTMREEVYFENKRHRDEIPIYCKLDGRVSGDPPEMKYQISAEWCLMDAQEVKDALSAIDGAASIEINSPESGGQKQMSAKIKSARVFVHGDKYRNVLIVWEEIA